MNDSAVLKKNPDFVTRIIEDETILIPIFKTSKEANYIYTLNKVAHEIWNLIDGKKSLAEIKKKVLKKFDTTSQEVDNEMKKFLKDLKEIKAIQ